MRAQGIDYMAQAFEDLEREESEPARLLEGSAEGHAARMLSPWEYAWLYASSPEMVELELRRMPRSAQEALEFALAAERRVEGFYNHVASEARDTGARAHAAGMAVDKCRHIDRIEGLLARNEAAVGRSIPRHAPARRDA